MNVVERFLDAANACKRRREHYEPCQTLREAYDRLVRSGYPDEWWWLLHVLDKQLGTMHKDLKQLWLISEPVLFEREAIEQYPFVDLERAVLAFLEENERPSNEIA